MKNVIDHILYHIFRPPSYAVLTVFTAVFFFLIWREIYGIGSYPKDYTPVYLTVIIGTSMSNLLKKSRWMK